ncbi:MAG: putative ABC transport system permease protein [Planctomycetota bacterium]|jgi:putative ABC transport system permease protein
MGLALTIARRSLLQRKGRTFFSILGIALGIATAVGVLTLDESTIRGITRVTPTGVPDLDVPAQPGGEGEEQIANIEGIESVARYFQNDANMRVIPADAGTTARGAGQRVRLFAFESETWAVLDIHRLSAGRELRVKADGTRDREVLIGEKLAADLSLSVGDEVMLSRPQRVGRRACIDGELQKVGGAKRDQPGESSFQIVGILAPEKLGNRARGQVVIVDYAWGEELYRGSHLSPRYWLKRDPAIDIERLRSSLGRSFSFELDRNVIRGEEADERAFRTGVRMAGLLALVLGLYVIFHTLSMSLAERVGEVGTLHALGVTRPQVARIFLLEAGILAGGGALVGLLGGIALAATLLANGITTLGVSGEELVLTIPWGVVLSLTVVGFAMAILGSIYPLSRLGGANTVAALRGEEALKAKGMARGFHLFSALLLAVVLPGLYFVLVPVVGEYTAPLVSVLLAGVGFMVLLIVLPLMLPKILTSLCTLLTVPFTRLWPLSGQLASRAMTQSGTRVAVSASAIALVSAGLVGLKGMTSSLRGEVEVWAEEAVIDKVWVKNLPGVDKRAFIEHLQQYPGVLGVESGSNRIHASFLLLGTDAAQLGKFGPLADQPDLIRRMRRDHGMILSRRLARERQYEVGDAVPVSKADGTLQEFEVIAISDAYGYFPNPGERMYGIVADSYLEKYFCLDVESLGEVSVRLAKGTDHASVAAAVRAFVPPATEDVADASEGTVREKSTGRQATGEPSETEQLVPDRVEIERAATEPTDTEQPATEHEQIEQPAIEPTDHPSEDTSTIVADSTDAAASQTESERATGSDESVANERPKRGKDKRPKRDRSMANVRCESGVALLEHHVMDIDRDFILFDILILLTAALAALGVLNGQLLAALERSKELGVLKALGTSRGQVAGMVLLESLVVGVVGGTIGVTLGAVMTPMMVGAIQDLAGLALPVRGAGIWLLAAFLGAAGVALLAGLYPIWRMNRFDAVRAVRTG